MKAISHMVPVVTSRLRGWRTADEARQVGAGIIALL